MQIAKKIQVFRKIKPLFLASALAFGFITQPAQAALTFNFNYLNPSQGFQDATLGAARQTALNQAADLLGAYFTNYTATLDYDVVSYSSTTLNTLASAGSGSFVVPGSFQQTFVQSKILSNGVDANGTAADGEINWNFGQNWGLTDNVAANEFDFKKVAVHELLHSFGFASYTQSDGAGLTGQLPGTADTWAIFDQFLTDASGNRLISNAGIFNSSQVATLTGGSGSLLFSGANAKAANGGASVNLYAPAIYADGSSTSHLDDDTLAFADLIMTSSTYAGLQTRTLSGVELGILKDIGYTNISAVPEPSMAWLMLGGLFVVLGAARRRNIL